MKNTPYSKRGDDAAGLARTALNGPAMGYGDEIEAGIRSILGKHDYDAYLKNARESREGFAKENPTAAAIAPIAASLPLGGGILKSGAKTTGGRLASALGKGAATGAVYGFGEGEGGLENRLENAAESGAIGAVMGPLAEGLGMAAGSAANRGWLGDRFKNWKGRRDLREQFGNIAEGKDWNGLSFGKLKPDQTRRARDFLGDAVSVDNKGNVLLSKNDVLHLYNRRIAGDGYEPGELARAANDALYGKKSRIYPQSPAEHTGKVAFVNEANPTRDVAFVRGDGDNMGLTSALKMREAEASRKYGSGGRPVSAMSSGQQGLSAVEPDAAIIPPAPADVNLSDLVGNNKAYKALRAGVRASDDVADTVQYRAASAMADNQKATVDNVLKELNSLNGTAAGDRANLAKEAYGAFMKDHGNTTVPGVKTLLRDYPDLQKYVRDARAKGLYNSRGKPEDSFAVLAEASRRIKMDLRDRMVNSSSSLQDKAVASSVLDKFLDGKFNGREYLDKAWRRSKMQMDLLDDLGEMNVGIADNVAKKLLNSKFKNEVSEFYSPELAGKIEKALQKDAKNFSRLSKLQNQAEGKIGQYGDAKPWKLMREVLESPGSLVAPAYDDSVFSSLSLTSFRYAVRA